MTRPQIGNTQTVQLEVTTDRKLRGDAILAPVPNNALEQRDSGLYVAQFTPVGAIVQQTALIGQTIPIYGYGTAPTPSAINFENALGDVGGFWNPATPTRLTIPSDGRYMISAHGRYRNVGTYGLGGFWGWAWIAKNGTQKEPLSLYNPNLNTANTDQALNATIPPGGGTNDCFSGTYMSQNLVDLKAGDYLESIVMFQQASAAATGSVSTLTTAGLGVGNPAVSGRGDIGTQFLAAVKVGA